LKLRTALVSPSVTSAFALAACGGESRTEETAAEKTSSAARARAETGEVRKALDSAVASMKQGDAKAADNAVSEGYLQHGSVAEVTKMISAIEADLLTAEQKLR
jgi:ABC-type enterochelin transport system substrate-binding protein